MVLRSDNIAGVDRALRVSHTNIDYLRVLAIIVLGAAAALFLAWFMAYLIQSSDMSEQNAQRVQMLDFVRLKRDESVERKDRKPPKPQLSQSPEIPPVAPSSPGGGRAARDLGNADGDRCGN